MQTLKPSNPPWYDCLIFLPLMQTKSPLCQLIFLPLYRHTLLPQASVVLDLKALGCRDPRAFPFLTPPPPSHMTAALLDLALLGATRPLLPYAMAAESQLDASITSSSKATSKLVPGSLKLPSFSAAAVSDDGHDDTKVSASSGSSVVGKEQPTPSFDVLVALSADAAVAPLTPLGKLMADLPVEPPVRYTVLPGVYLCIWEGFTRLD